MSHPPPIFLYHQELRVYSPASKKRPGPKLIADMRRSLDVAGLQLLDLLLQEQFADPQVPGLQRDHLLALRWDQALWESHEPASALAYHFPDVIQHFSKDIADVGIQLTLSHMPPHPARDRLIDLRQMLASLQSPLTGAAFEDPYQDLRRPVHTLGLPDLAAKLNSTVRSLASYALLPLHRPGGPTVQKYLRGDVRGVVLNFGWVFERVSPDAEKIAVDVALHRLRSWLAMSPPSTFPDALKPYLGTFVGP